MFRKFASLAVGLTAAATLLPTAPAHALGVNSCYVYVSRPWESGSCDYVGAGGFTVVDFDQYSGDVDAWVYCTTFSNYYDYSTQREVLTGPTRCTVYIQQYGTGSGRIQLTNKVA